MKVPRARWIWRVCLVITFLMRVNNPGQRFACQSVWQMLYSLALQRSLPIKHLGHIVVWCLCLRSNSPMILSKQML